MNDSKAIRADYQNLASRLSMNLYFVVEKINAASVAKKLVLYSDFGTLSKSEDPTIREVAAVTAETYSNLESIHFLYESNSLDPEEMLASMLLSAVSRAKLAHDNHVLHEHQRTYWPKILPFAERFSGSSASRGQVLEFRLPSAADARFPVEPGKVPLEFENRSGKTLTNCTLMVDVADMWGKYDRSYFFFEEWPASEALPAGALRSGSQVAAVSYSLWSDQLKQKGILPGGLLGPEEVQLKEKYLRAFALGKEYTGTWTDVRNASNFGTMSMKVTSLDPNTAIFQSPKIQVEFWDPTKPQEGRKQRTGYLVPKTDRSTLRLVGFALEIEADWRTFSFRLEGDSVVGDDSYRAKYLLK